MVNLPPGSPGLELGGLLQGALDAPLESPRIEELAATGDRVVIVVSDATRSDPRSAFIAAVRERLPSDTRTTLAIANGTHAPREIESLGIDPALLAGLEIVNHDSRDLSALVDLGRTARGTPVRVNRVAAEADLIIATGQIKPHYFAGFSAGCKAIVPGLAENEAIRINHRLKTSPSAAAGIVAGNPCREDLLEAASMVADRRFLLNAVFDGYYHPRYAFSGNLEAAFLAGVQACRPLYCVRAPRAELVIASDTLPLTASLYQASKLAAGVACLLRPGGTLVLVAECAEGTGPIDTVNQAIYELGVKPRLPEQHTIVLVSSMTPAQVAPTYCTWAPSVAAAIEEHKMRVHSERQDNPRIAAGNLDRIVVVPRAGTGLVEAILEENT